jgi:hypothetical protein
MACGAKVPSTPVLSAASSARADVAAASAAIRIAAKMRSMAGLSSLSRDGLDRRRLLKNGDCWLSMPMLFELGQ